MGNLPCSFKGEVHCKTIFWGLKGMKTLGFKKVLFEEIYKDWTSVLLDQYCVLLRLQHERYQHHHHLLVHDLPGGPEHPEYSSFQPASLVHHHSHTSLCCLPSHITSLTGFVHIQANLAAGYSLLCPMPPYHLQQHGRHQQQTL